MPQLPDPSPVERFKLDLRRVLYRLYDPAELRRSALYAALEPEAKDSPRIFCDLIVSDIERLRPTPGASPLSDASRAHQILYHRFVEQFSQAEVADSLGLSIRQLRRHEAQALQTLAELIWTRYQLAERYSSLAEPVDEDFDVAESDAHGDGACESGVLGIDPLTDQQELAWLSASLKGECCSAGELIWSAMKTLEPLGATKKARIIPHYALEASTAVVQATAARQVLLIILTEAIHAASGGGEVAMEIDSIPDLSPSDTHRLSVNVKAQCGEQVTPLAHGWSERLEIARKVAALANGALECGEQCADGCFHARLTLPIVNQAAVLFIDDNADTLRLFERYLATSRYRFQGARTLEQATSLIDHVVPQVIVLDLMMPGVDGWEVLGRLRNHPRTERVPVIVCSILPLEQLALSLGASAFLQKRVSRMALLEVLDRETRDLERESR